MFEEGFTVDFPFLVQGGNMRKKSIFWVVLFMIFRAGFSYGGELGFIEQFSLNEDRTGPLKQLIPGTEDYYYYHCIHFN